MIFISHRKKTSKYFCNLPNHVLCYHDTLIKTLYDHYQTKRKEVDHLRYEEKIYQKLLTDILKIGHQTIHLGTKNWYSDISSEDLLLEIKNAKNTRDAIGQIICYEKAMKRNNLKKSIIIFGELPHKRELDVYIQVCGDLNVDLIYVQLEELIELRHFICSEDGKPQQEVLNKLQKFAFVSNESEN